MTLAATLHRIEAYDACRFDERLLVTLEEAGAGLYARRPLVVATPSFQGYATSELSSCCAAAFPVFSVTGPACALQCDHCRAEILRPMIPATTPGELDAKVREMARTRQLAGFLLSGGSNSRNEIAYERFYPTIERLKRDMPGLRVAIHSGLLDRARARRMAAAGVDTAMMDVIGADETIREVYHLDRPAADFASTLAALCETSMEVVPHIVIGLHRGRIVGERSAIEMCAGQPITGLVLVIVMPHHALPGTFATPCPTEIAELFVVARARLPQTQINLGCARPYGVHRRTVDAYAVMSGLDGIAFPSEGALTLARNVGRPIVRHRACCSMRRGLPAEEVLA